MKEILWIIYAIFALFPVRRIPLVYICIDDIFEWNDYTIKEGEMRVPTFYALHVDVIDSTIYQVAIYVNAVQVAFAAIHSAGWSLVFPSHPDRLGVPVVLLIVPLFIRVWELS